MTHDEITEIALKVIERDCTRLQGCWVRDTLHGWWEGRDELLDHLDAEAKQAVEVMVCAIMDADLRRGALN
jgi:hypothetical protein